MKLIGFVRSFRFGHVPLVPVFKSTEMGEAYAIQVIENGKVAGFASVDAVPEDRLILKGERSYPDVEVGDAAVLAFDRGSGDIAIRRPEKYDAMLSDFLTDKWDAVSPFVALELAILLLNETAMKRAIPQCLDFLGGPRSNIARKWLAGSGVPDGVRAYAAKLLGGSGEKATSQEDDANWFMMFSGPRFLVRGLTTFCREELGAQRAVIIRQVLSKRDLLPLSRGGVEETLTDLLELIERSTRDERGQVHRGSWGRVSMPFGWKPDDIQPNFADFVGAVERSAIAPHLTHIGVDLRKDRVRLLIYLWHCLLQGKQRAYLENLSISGLDRDFIR